MPVFQRAVPTRLFATPRQDALEYDEEAQELVSPNLGVAFPIKDGIPNLLPEAGRVLDTGENAPQREAEFADKQ